jgi:hypothetical protein
MVVAKLGVEGGGVTILGICADGGWSFWQEGSSIALDANDEEEWQSWASQQSRDLSAVVPGDWPLMYPEEVHPEFVGWFRESYDAARAGVRDDLRASQARWRDPVWQRVFEGTQGA